MKFVTITRILFCAGVLCAAPETIAIGLEDGPDPHFDDPEFIDSSPGLAFFALFAIIILLILLGAGVVFAIIACGLAAALAGLGIVSASAVYGLAKRSPASGFRALFLLCGATAGLAAGVGLAYIIAWIFSQPVHGWTIPLLGGFAGLASGLLIAGLFNLAWCKAIRFWNEKRIAPPSPMTALPRPHKPHTDSPPPPPPTTTNTTAFKTTFAINRLLMRPHQ